MLLVSACSTPTVPPDAQARLDGGERTDAGDEDAGGRADAGGGDAGSDAGPGVGYECGVAPTIVTSLDFSDGESPAGWSQGAQDGGSLEFSDGYLHAGYPNVSDGQTYVWFSYDISALGTLEVFIEFDARMTSPHGFKFLKFFGESGDGYANTTVGLDYTGIDNGGMFSIGFGDGTNRENDTQQIIRLDGEAPELIGRSYGATAVVETPQGARFASSDWGTDWHHFRVRQRFNSGTSTETEVADGRVYLEIDGRVYVDAAGLFNRHYANGPLRAIGLCGWSQGDGGPFTVDYDNIVISTGCFADSAP